MEKIAALIMVRVGRRDRGRAHYLVLIRVGMEKPHWKASLEAQYDVFIAVVV